MRFIHNDPRLKERRKLFRKNNTNEETILWNYLRNKRLGKRFRRQFGMGQFIVDFYCHELKLIIELDGIQHQNRLEYDQEREWFLESQGNTILRFPNYAIHGNLQEVLEIIQSYL
jgi:very-short-patch-repair endonuclease